MTVTYNIDDRYCPCGNSWIFVPASFLFRDYYFCPHCDKIFTPTVEEKTKEWFAENYRSDKVSELKNLARIRHAKEQVTTEDLVKLGYLKTKTKNV